MMGERNQHGCRGLRALFSLERTGCSVHMPYYECPTCGGGYVIDPAPAHPKCDRDGATLKRASEASYVQRDSEDDFESPPTKTRTAKAKR